MFLDDDQEACLAGERGRARQWALEVLNAEGRKNGAEKLIPIRSAHLADWSDASAGPFWKEVSELEKIHFLVPTTVNPWAGSEVRDRSRLELLYSLGAKPSETCVPFLVGNSVRRGDHLAWGGRSAATFANSVLGALTNLEEPDVVLASAMVGLVPEHGLHLDEARRPTVAVRIPKDMHIEAGRLGQILSGVVRNEVPVICGTHFDMAQARRFVFNLNAEGNVPLAYLRDDPPENVDVMDLDPGACRYEEAGFQPDLVVLGCPHLSEQEINEWARRLADARSLDMEIWTYTAQLCHDKCPKTIRPLQLRGKVRTGTCPLADMEDMKGRKVVCDSPVLAECLAQHRLDVRYLPSEHLAHMIKGYDQSLPQDTCHSNVHISPRP